MNLKTRSIFLGALAGFLFLPANAAQAAGYIVEPMGSFVRGHFFISDGPAIVYSTENTSWGNRLRIGGEVHLGEDYQIILGIVFLDRTWSGETSSSVGAVSRDGMGFEAGYFVIPDRLWAMFSIGLEDIHGSAAIGSITTADYQLALGYRFYMSRAFNLAGEASYVFSPMYTASTFNYSTNTSGSVTFPQASIWSINLRIGLDLGGR